ncbi:TPA: hypothetical protein ACX6S2_003438 [Photobacterium damselae]
MGLVLKLTGVRFNNPNLPTLDDFGIIPQKGLVGLWDFNNTSNPYVDCSANGNDLSVNPSASDVIYDKSTRTCRFGSNVVTTAGQLVTTNPMSGLDQTVIAVYRGKDTRSVHYLTRWYGSTGSGNGVIWYLGNTTGFDCRKVYYYDSGSLANSAINNVVVPLNEWDMFAFACDSDGVSAQVGRVLNNDPGQGWMTEAFLGNGPDVLPDNQRLCFGNNVTSGEDSSQCLNGDIAFLAVWDRKLTSSELRSSYKAIKSMMTDKNIII